VIEFEAVGIVQRAPVFRVDDGLSPVMPAASRMADIVLPLPVPPARPISSPTFSLIAGRNSNVIRWVS
jgi:hypothetical protein